jgi:RNA polymerase primary sigma factor
MMGEKEAAMKEKDLEDALLELAKKRGEVTFEELNDTFPAEYFPLEEMERFMGRLRHLGIRVVESRQCERTKARHKRAA